MCKKWTISPKNESLNITYQQFRKCFFSIVRNPTEILYVNVFFFLLRISHHMEKYIFFRTVSPFVLLSSNEKKKNDSEKYITIASVIVYSLLW